ELVGAGHRGGVDDLLEARIGLGGSNVFPHRSAEQKALLHHDADLAAQMRQIELANIVSIDPHRAELYRVHAADQSGQRRLAGTAAADDAEHRPRRYSQRNIVEGRRSALAVAEDNMLELDCPCDWRL